MASATVASSALLSFSENIVSDTQTNVRNTILLAILSANSSTNRNRDSDSAAAWFTAYWNYLTANGWKGPAPTALSSAASADYNAPVDVTLVQQMASLLNPAQAALLNRVLLSLPLSGGADAQAIFGEASTDTTTAMAANSSDPIRAVNFVVGVSSGTPSGNVILDSCHISYRYIPPDVLFGFAGRISDIQAVSHTIEFNCTDYASSNGSGKPLTSSQTALVSNIDIGPTVGVSGGPISSSDSDKISTWAQNHIIARNEYDSTGNVTGVDYIEVNKGPTTASGGYPFDIVLFQALEISGSIDVSSLACNFTAYLLVSFLPKINIGGITGNLKDGITLTVGLQGVASGSITLHILNTSELYCKVQLDTILGNWDKDIDLFNLPFL